MGTKSKKKAKTRLDAYYRLAKDQGYRSRAAFKLIQLNRKYDFLAKSRSLVDLCAAPGGWCQVAAKFMPIGSKIIGVDLVPIPPIRGVKTFVGDITDDKTRKIILTYTKKEPVDAVIHDGAPNVGGVWSKDLFAQNALVLSALKTACSLLRPGGWFVSKVFRSTDFQKIIWVLKQFFEKVEATKPLASRMESAEIFVVCAGYKAPKTIDPKLFQAQHVFADVGTERVMLPSGALVVPKTNVPQGYEEFNTIVSRVATMSDFLRCSDPKEFLRTYHEIRFPEEDRKYLGHKGSKKELIFLCMDLQQVSEGDRKKIIRWREALLRAYPIVEAGPHGPHGAEEDVNSDDEMVVIPDEDAMQEEAVAAAKAKGAADDAETIALELLRIRKAHEKELKRKQKKLVDRKLKQVRGLINYNPYDRGQHPTDMGEGFDGEAEEGLSSEWALAQIGRLGEADMADAFDEMYEEPEGGQLNLPLNIPMDVNVDDDNEIEMGGDEFEEDGRQNLLIEGEEDEWDVDNYGNYVPVARSDRVKIYDGPSDEDEEGEEEGAQEDGESAKKTKGKAAKTSNLSKEEYLAAKKAERKAKKAQARRADDDDDGASDEEDEEEDDGLTPAERKMKARKEKDEEALDEAGKQAKWQRRHLNIDQVLNRTFPKPKDSKAAKKAARLEEERIEMRAPALGSSLTAKSGKRTGGIVEHPLHDEGDLSDDDEDDAQSFDDDSDLNDEDDHVFSDDDDIDANRGSMGKTSKLSKDKKRVLLPTAGFLTAQELTKQQRKAVMKDNKEKRKAKREAKKAAKGKKGAKEDTTFEEIPLAMTDPEIRNRTLAMATAMLDKKTRHQMLESGINRYMNNDDDDLPDWFIKDEHRNCVLPTPVTAYDIEQQKLRFIEIANRPSKKVMEAVGRKRKRAQRMLRGMIEKGKTDPRVREKTAGLSIRTLMRSKSLSGNDKKKKNQRIDNKVQGEQKRERHRLRQAKKGHAKRR